jgi:hypothetical protein
MATSIPITLNANPVPVGIQAVNIDELLSIISEYVTGTISQDVSFFISGSTPPLSNQGLFYNTTTKRFMAWNNDLGAYTPISELQVGDMKVALRQSDDLTNGWVLLDGRIINSITSLTEQQKSNLLTLFATGTLPNYTFLSGLSGLPADNSFTNISNPAVNPVAGTIGNLSIGGSYSQTEIQALRNNTEFLSASTSSLQTTVGLIKSTSETMLKSLNATTTEFSPKWFVFAGYPV